MSASKTQPALVGGLVMGVLSALPIVSAGNWCCCLWVVSGGLVAAYLLEQNQADPITPADGAVVGMLAGILGAVIFLLVSIPVSLIVSPMERAILRRLSESADMPPAFRTYLADSSSFRGLRTIVGFLTMLFVGTMFSTLGGVLGAAIFKSGPPPPPRNIPEPPPVSS